MQIDDREMGRLQHRKVMGSLSHASFTTSFPHWRVNEQSHEMSVMIWQPHGPEIV